MTDFPSLTRVPLYSQVREALLSRISSGEWMPGDKIPPEPQLASGFGVSMGTLRKAVDTLVADGILQRLQGSGTFVTSFSQTGSWNRFQHFEPIDGGALYEQRHLFDFETLPATDVIATHLRVPQGTPVWHLLRTLGRNDRVFGSDELYLRQDIFSKLTRERIEKELLPSDSLYQFYERELGVEITSAKNTLTWTLIEGHEAHRLHLPDPTPCFSLERVSMTYQHLPVEYRIEHVDARLFRIRFDS